MTKKEYFILKNTTVFVIESNIKIISKKKYKMQKIEYYNTN